MMAKHLIIVIFIITISAIPLVYYDIIIPNSIVEKDVLERWTDAYISEYMKVIEEGFVTENGFYFDFYGEHPFNINYVISLYNGIGIEFIPINNSNINRSFYYTNNRIELAIF